MEKREVPLLGWGDPAEEEKNRGKIKISFLLYHD